MTRLPGDRAVNHGGVGWVDPPSGGAALVDRISRGALPGSLIRIVVGKLTLRLTGLGRDLNQTEDRVVERCRADGWPICPWCEQDELAAVKALQAEPEAIDLCYVCGPIEVL